MRAKVQSRVGRALSMGPRIYLVPPKLINTALHNFLLSHFSDTSPSAQRILPRSRSKISHLSPLELLLTLKPLYPPDPLFTFFRFLPFQLVLLPVATDHGDSLIPPLYSPNYRCKAYGLSPHNLYNLFPFFQPKAYPCISVAPPPPPLSQILLSPCWGALD